MEPSQSLNKKITLLICIHNHQPIGNFGWVYEEAYQKAYMPFIEVLKKHPRIRLSLHYSGSLIDWLIQNHPEFISQIKELTKIGQIELLSGGYYEPIFPLIPQQDRIGQIKSFTSAIKERIGFSPEGCWLPERVWEPDLVMAFKEAGIKYTIVDDTHFRRYRLKGSMAEVDGEILNYYITEEQGDAIFIFPSSKTLRYYIPFKLPEETIKLLKTIASCQSQVTSHKSQVCIAFADDGEKFGLWPHTYKWVYEERWLENFFHLLEENRDAICLSTFSDYIKMAGPQGLIYLAPSSYDEMLEWSGGYFRNFLVKYAEANNMHKKMLYVSEKIRTKSKGLRAKSEKIEQARQELYKGQTNCAYWHGVFGGLYLRHLRNAVYKHLIEAEKMIDRTTPAIKPLDFDKDGFEEVIFESKDLNIYIDPHRGGAIFELDYKPLSINLCNVLTRREEPYHKKVAEAGRQDAQRNKPESIHNLMGVKESGLEKLLVYDSYRKGSLLDHVISENAGLNDFMNGVCGKLCDFINTPYIYHIKKYSLRLSNDWITKSIALKNKNSIYIDYNLEGLAAKESNFKFGMEFNLNLSDPSFSSAGALEDINMFTIKDSDSNLRLEYRFDAPQNVWFYPIETVSESEGGLERIYQGLCVLFHSNKAMLASRGWKISLCLRFTEER